MKIALVEAGLPTGNLAWKAWVDAKGRFAVPSVGLVSLASLVPDQDEVFIHDEKIQGPADELEADVVGISYKTMNASRAYGLADTYRSRGMRVVLGGLHATLCPDEASRHGDIVVLGEGEKNWPRLLNDLHRGSWRQRYGPPARPPPIHGLPPIRMDLLRHDKYFFHATQSARGCSLDCEFCPTRSMFGQGFRLRDLDTVVAEIEAMLRLENKPVMFTEGVFGAGDMPYIESLTARLSELDMRYAAVCEFAMLNQQIVDWLARSGCALVFLNLDGERRPEEVAFINHIQEAGITVWGYFMFGFEFHGPGVFQAVVDYVQECHLKHISLTLLAPYKGTPMGRRLAAEGRILSTENDLYDQAQVVFEPAGMSPEELARGFAFASEALAEQLDFSRLGTTFGL